MNLQYVMTKLITPNLFTVLQHNTNCTNFVIKLIKCYWFLSQKKYLYIWGPRYLYTKLVCLVPCMLLTILYKSSKSKVKVKSYYKSKLAEPDYDAWGPLCSRSESALTWPICMNNTDVFTWIGNLKIFKQL